MINEINSNNGLLDIDDYVEFINPTSAPVNISGWSFVDATGNGPTPRPRFTWPAGTIVQPGEIIAVDTMGTTPDAGTSEFPFGLGSSDSVFLHNAADAIVDMYTWTAHVTSVGRCPGATAFTAMVQTYALANVCGDGGTL